MAITIKDNTVVAVEKEVTEGTYVAPSGDTSYVQTLSDGTELTPSKELLERNIFNGSIGKATPRTGLQSVTGALPVEFRGNDTAEGAAPEYDKLIEAGMGSKRTGVSKTADDTDSGTPHTTTRIYLLDGDAANYAAGDSVTVKVAGDYHTSPITLISTAGGDNFIDLLIPADNAYNDGDVITAFTTYTLEDENHPSLSITKFVEDAVAETAVGSKVLSMSLENFVTGQLASLNFSIEGLSADRTITANPFTPAFDDTLPPVILQACIFQDGILVDVNEVSFSMENSLGFVTSTCSPTGKISSRITERTITGTINPYKQDDSVDQFDKFDANTQYSLFITAHLPSGVAGEYTTSINIYMPICITTEIGESDQDGILQDELTFSANRGGDSATDEIYISYN